MPKDSSQKRLAVETEDHPLEYANFAGTIPKGEYGAGTVKILDRSSYEPKVWSDNMIEVTLSGQTFKGLYVLVKLKKTAREKNWLLLKAAE